MTKQKLYDAFLFLLGVGFIAYIFIESWLGGH